MTTPHASLESRLEALERENAEFRQQLARFAAREPAPAHPQQVRLARTYSSTPESYPAAGDTFDIRFLDGALDVWSPGDREATYTPRSAGQQQVAHSVDGSYWPRDTIVRVCYQNRHWWILDKQPRPSYAEVRGSRTFNGSLQGGLGVTSYLDNAMPLELASDVDGFLEEFMHFGVQKVRFKRPCQGHFTLQYDLDFIPGDGTLTPPAAREGWFHIFLNNDPFAGNPFMVGGTALFRVRQEFGTLEGHTNSISGVFQAPGNQLQLNLRVDKLSTNPAIPVSIRLGILIFPP